MSLKKLLLLFALNIGFLQAQNFTVTNSQQPTCFGACNGFVTYTTGLASGPFTAILANSASCPNSTTQTSASNTITVSNICACSGIYTVTIKNMSNVVVGTELIQFPAYATVALVVNVNSITASCAGCCSGSANVSYTGGYITGTPTYSLDGGAVVNVNPLVNLCDGTHTICMTDASNCVACKTFTTPLASGLFQNTLHFPIHIYPNPAQDAVFIESTQSNPISKVEIFDLTGRKISVSEALIRSEIKLQMDTRPLTPGLYYLNVYNTQGQLMQHKKFVKVD